MAAIAYLFLLTVAFASGAFNPLLENGSRLKIYQGIYPNFAISPEYFLDDCRFRRASLACHIQLRNVFRGIRDPEPKLERNDLKANSRNLIPRILNGNNIPDKPESYINSILDEDKRDGSNFNASDNVLNSTWIEIKDPRKTATPIKGETAPAIETDEFVSFNKENIAAEANPSIAEDKGNKTKNTETGGSNDIDEETTTEMQQTTTINETSYAVSGIMDGKTTVTGETSDFTLTQEVTGGETTANQDPILTVGIEEENKGNTNVQKEATGVSSSETAEKSTTSDLHTDSAKFRFKITTTNTTVNETDIAVTTEKITEEKFFSTEENLPAESRSTSTSVVPEDLNNDTSLATNDFTPSTVFITTLTSDQTESESVSASGADISPSSETESATSSSTVIFPTASVTESSVFTTGSSDGGFTSTMITDSKSSNNDYVTKSIPVVPEHTINIRSIKIAKIVLSVLLLVTGLIAVVMLAVYMFKVRRGAVQYDQLTLLP